ncbi:MAG: vitamin K epoxide reductase family protein [Anaerolineae bacterium]|nr:vitamin K epoxide reductase family protein [Anaerolineae bacterium]
MKLSRPLAIAVLALLGIAVSAYLLTVHWGWWSAVCFGVGDCQSVNTSRFSEFLGLPVALWGIGAYAAIFILSVALIRGIALEWAPRLLFLMAAVGVVFSAYLTYIELYVIYEICPWCVLSALIILSIAILSALELYKPHDPEPA